MSEKRKGKRRSDSNPVRVDDDGRIAYGTGGSPGTGNRVMERCGSLEAAELRAADVRKRQLDRYGTWPALALPKGNQPRTTQLWACYSDIAASLIQDALDREGPDHGWLFPRYRSEKKWADQAGKLAGAARERCGWQWRGFHWLRHGWASWSLAPESDLGYGINPTRVHEWLGHAKLNTTTDTYVHKPRGTTRTSARPPGACRLAEVRGLIQAQQAGQAASLRNPNVARADWETVVADHLASFAAATGDVVEHVGTTPAPGSSTRKAGDVIVRVMSGDRPTIAVECKNRTRALSVRESQAVLADARRVRRAVAGVLVVPTEAHVPGPSRFCRVGAVDFVVAADDPTAFILVLSVLRELSLVIAAAQQPGASVDVGRAQTSVGHALELLPRWDELTRQVSTADKALANIRTTAEALRGALTGHLQEASRALRPDNSRA